ncbi:MAG: tetratricopeptide repeat protein [Flavobacteriales bacterium]
MKKYFLIILSIFYVFTNVNAQKNSFYPVGTQNKNKNKQKEENSKDDYQYKSFYFTAIKQKSLENFDEAIKYFEKCIKLNKEQSSPYYEIAKIYLLNNELQESYNYSKQAYHLDKSNKWYAQFYAEILFNMQDYYESAKTYKSLIKQHKENENYYLDLSKVYLYDNNLRLAIKTYNDLERLKGVNHYTSTQKHKLYLELKDFNKAAVELENLLIEFPYDTEIYEILSDCYILSGDFDKALEILIKLSELKPNSPSIHLSLSDFYLQKGNFEKYREELVLAFSSEKLDVQSKINKIVPLLTPIYENKLENFDFVFELSKIIVEIHPFNAMSNYIYADLLRIDQKTELSVSYYKKVVEINKNEIGAWEEMLFLELRLNKLDSLNTDSEQAIEIFPTNPIFYYLNGLSFYYKKNYEKTIEPIKIGVNFVVSNPNLSSEMYSILGNSYNELKDFENSDISYERALEYIPDNVQVLNNYAYYLSLREENLERAEEMSKKTIEMFPEEANYIDTYAWILYKMKKYEQAKSWMQKAIDISESETFYSHMAKILIELGEKEESEFYLEKSKLLKESSKNE